MSSLSDTSAWLFDDRELDFRRDVQAVLCAASHTQMGYYRGRGGATRELYRQFGARGWLSMGWPEAIGGSGKPPSYEYLLWNEAAYHRAARPDLGPGIVAHVIANHGTPDQHTRYLPTLASGDACFALGYSEPEAGSDLSGVRTRAHLDPGLDHYVVNGEKCWTSDAHHADYLWLLCRTGSLDERSRGLTLLIVDLSATGVTVTPIETIDGHRLNQVFLDNVEVPIEDRVGAEGAAWQMVREALAVERHIQLLPGRLRRDLEDLRSLIERTHTRTSAARETLADLTARVQQVEASSVRTVGELCGGRSAIAEAARTKLLGTRLCQDIPRAAFDICGPLALDSSEDLAFLWKQSFMETIGGGTSEVMLSIIARESLGLGARK